jgi:hypothetical protein
LVVVPSLIREQPGTPARRDRNKLLRAFNIAIRDAMQLMQCMRNNC